MANEKFERKYLAHYIDVSFGDGKANYVRLGKELEEYYEELNPDVEVTKNILGEQNVNHNGYEVQSDVDPFYAREDDPLFTHLSKIANERLTGDDCKTTKLDVLVDKTGAVVWAYREECYLVPTQFGGDTSGVQIPFTVYNCGNRTAGTFNTQTKEFTPTTAVSGENTVVPGEHTGN